MGPSSHILKMLKGTEVSIWFENWGCCGS